MTYVRRVPLSRPARSSPRLALRSSSPLPALLPARLSTVQWRWHSFYLFLGAGQPLASEEKSHRSWPCCCAQCSRCWWLQRLLKTHSASGHKRSPSVWYAFICSPVAVLSASALAPFTRTSELILGMGPVTFVFRTCMLLQLFFMMYLETFCTSFFCYVWTGFSCVGSYASIIIYPECRYLMWWRKGGCKKDTCI